MFVRVVVTCGGVALSFSFSSVTCQWDTGTCIRQLLTWATSLVADTLTAVIVQVKVRQALTVAHTVTFLTVKDEVVIWTPGISLALA